MNCLLLKYSFFSLCQTNLGFEKLFLLPHPKPSPKGEEAKCIFQNLSWFTLSTFLLMGSLPSLCYAQNNAQDFSCEFRMNT